MDSSLAVDASDVSVPSSNVEINRDISRYLIQGHSTDNYIGRIKNS